MPTGVQTIQEAINKINAMAASADAAKPKLLEISEILNKLLARPSAVGGAIGWPKVEELQQLGDAMKVLEEAPGRVGERWSLAMRTLRMQLLDIGQIATKAFQGGVGLYPQIPVSELEKSYLARMTGGVSAFQKTPELLLTAQSSLAAGITDLTQKYEGLGWQVDKTVPVLNTASQAWEIQATLVKRLGDNLQVTTQAQERYSATTGKALAPTSLQQELLTRLGPQRLATFEKELSHMGLTLENLNNVQVDAINNIARFSFRTGESGEAVRTATFHFDRWGRAVGDMSTRFKGFEQAIASNIEKVIRWAIAVGFVYGGWRQMQEMFRQMGEIQEGMADLAIVTGESMEAMGDYFERTADVAREMGIDVIDVFKATDEAIRATGGLPETERTAAAFDLLADSAAYAKLTGIDTARAVDLLVASLRQMGMELTEGDQLLNKWIAVSRHAHVSLLDFGEAFSVTAAAAADAGVDIDLFNGLVGTMSEVTGLAPREAANALRALFGALQLDQSIEALESYGIAVYDTSGHIRDFNDILYDLYKAQIAVEGQTLLTADATNDLGYALGGQGARRGAQMTAIIENLDRAYELSNISAEAQGELQRALEVKTSTLQTAVTELKNAFTEWAEVMGTEGGVLDLLTKIVEGMTALAKIAGEVGTALGAAGTGAALFLAAWGLGTRFALPQRLGALGGAGGALTGTAAMGAMGGGPAAGRLATGLQQFGPSALYGGVAGLGVGLATGSAAQGIGAAIGAAFGFTAGGPIGGMIGTVIGTAFADVIETAIPIWKQDLGIVPAPRPAMMTSEQIRQEAETRIYGPGMIGTLAEAATGIATAIWQQITPSLQLQQGPAGIGVGQAPPGVPGGPLTRATYEETVRLATQVEGTTRSWLVFRAVLGQMFPQFRMTQTEIARTTELLDEQEKRLQETAAAAAPPTELTAADIRRRQYLQLYGGGLEQQMALRRRALPFEFARGDIESAKEYNTQVQHTYEILNRLPSVYYALETSAAALGEQIGETGEEYNKLGMEMVSWSEESLSFIQEQALGLIQLQDLGQATTDSYRQFYTLLEGIRREERLRQIEPLPGFVDLRDVEERTGLTFETLMEQARSLQDQFIEQLGIPPEVLQTIDEWVMYYGDAFGTVEGLARQFWDAIVSEAEEARQAQEEAFNVRRLKDIDPSKMGEIARANRYWVEYLARIRGQTAQQYLQMEGQQFNLVLGPGNVLQQIYSTNEAMLFALQDILETEEKQLEGMWNIPSGATFWVPLTSLFYQKAGAGGFPELPELIPPTNRTANATEDTAGKLIETNSTLAQILQKLGLPESQIIMLEQMLAAGAIEPQALGGLGILPESQLTMLLQQLQVGMVKPGAVRTYIQPLETPEKTIQKIVPYLPTILREYEKAIPQQQRWPYLPTMLRGWEQPPETGGVRGLPSMEPVSVTVEIPPIKGDFTIQNIVNLDGRLLMSYINRLIAQALSNTIKSTRPPTKGVR